ncbi:MAG: hypothetical protein ACRC0R_03925 [Cetobacterium sp.]
MNVLSVDIDFLFTDMNLIQKCFDVDLSPERSWQVVGWKNEGKKFEPCKKSADFLNEVLKNKVTSKTKIEVIVEHDEIIKILEDNNCEEVNMFNIDNHHDISYGDNLENLTIENWVLHARKRNLIRKYSWICQDDSEKCENTTILYDFCSWKDVDIEKIPKMDIIVLCVSRHFTPIKYWGLADSISKELNYLIQKLILLENNN